MNKLHWLKLSVFLLVLTGCTKEDFTGLEPVALPCITEAVQIDYKVESSRLDFRLLHNNYPEASTPNGPNWGVPIDMAVVDYDNDGILDAITGNSDYTTGFAGVITRRKIQFYKGDCEGNLTLDTREEYYDKFVGPVFARKTIIGDYNNDNRPDIVFVDNGHDDQTGNSTELPGSYPIILMSNSEGYFDYVVYEKVFGVWHTAASADFDNDGDLDIYFPYHQVLVNRGDGIFDREPFPFGREDQAGTLEFYDLDGDGILEMLYGSSDTPKPRGVDQNESWIANPSGILGKVPYVEGFGIVSDFDFYDLDQDGTAEVIVNRTSGPEHVNGHYSGWYVQILKFVDNQLIDVTESHIEQNSEFFGEWGWIHWLNVGDTDGDGTIELYADDINNKFKWELINGFFYRIV